MQDSAIMRKMSKRRWIKCGALGAFLLALVQTIDAGELRAHEWGTFTTLHLPSGSSIPWYQPQSLWNQDSSKSVSDLPSFVKGNLLIKGGMMATARMETPVIYFYTDEEQTVDVKVHFSGGVITEYYPGSQINFQGWKSVELIPPADAGDISTLLPIDPKRPDNHYYEARAVPDAALVRQQQPVEKEGEPAQVQHEKFLFYRGAGNFDTRLRPSMDENGILTVQHLNPDFEMQHVWALQSSAESLRWEKLPSFPAFNTEDAKKNMPPVVRQLEQLGENRSREDAIAALKNSMISTLVQSGLSKAEATAMVATWDEQWYDEPGQRLCSVVPQSVVKSVLPLEISPAPVETVRVFVHRQEILDPGSLLQIELAMAPHMEAQQTKKLIEEEQLGRFVYGVIEHVASDVGHRTRLAYRKRGIESIEAKEGTNDQVKVAATAEQASR